MTEDYDDFPDYIPNMGAWGESKPGDTPGERQRKRDRQAGKHAGSEREGEEGQGDRERRSKCVSFVS